MTEPTGKVVEVFGEQYAECKEIGCLGGEIFSCNKCDMNIVCCVEYCRENVCGPYHYKKVPSPTYMEYYTYMINTGLKQISLETEPYKMALMFDLLGSILVDMKELGIDIAYKG